MQPQTALKTKDPYKNAKNRADMIAKEYEDFAYIVSHDLNAPLRHVKEFTRLLVGSKGDDLNEEEKTYISFLEKSLQKLDMMQDALLTFSRLNTRAGPLKEIDCNRIVAHILEKLSDTIDRDHPAIECANLPRIVAEPKQIEILFTHLIDNGLKFHDDEDRKKKLSISGANQGDAWLFQIKDNGIGIPPEHHETVFRLFRRLSPEQHPGIGAGLTIAQKIVHHHGGEILIESSPDKGTSVYFTLAKPA